MHVMSSIKSGGLGKEEILSGEKQVEVLMALLPRAEVSCRTCKLPP